MPLLFTGLKLALKLHVRLLAGVLCRARAYIFSCAFIDCGDAVQLRLFFLVTLYEVKPQYFSFVYFYEELIVTSFPKEVRLDGISFNFTELPLLLSQSGNIWRLAFCDFSDFCSFHFHLALLFPLLSCFCSAQFVIVPFPVASPLLWLLVLEGSYGEFF